MGLFSGSRYCRFSQVEKFRSRDRDSQDSLTSLIAITKVLAICPRKKKRVVMKHFEIVVKNIVGTIKQVLCMCTDTILLLHVYCFDAVGWQQ